MNLGRIWIWITVARTYWAIIMQLIAVGGILRMLNMGWWLIVLLLLGMIPMIILVVYLHMKYIFPKWLEEQWTKNPAYKRLINDK